MARTLGFGVLHADVAFAVGLAMTGDRWPGGAAALVEPACNMVVCHGHQRLWQRLELRRAAAGGHWPRRPRPGPPQRFFGRYRSVIVPS
jgi:uncharacterized membrane protein